MSTRRFAACLLFASVLALNGCASLEPNHVTVITERDQSETASDRRTRTSTTKIGISATYDLR